jgi:hypothetical protein
MRVWAGMKWSVRVGVSTLSPLRGFGLFFTLTQELTLWTTFLRHTVAEENPIRVAGLGYSADV